ncbi:hypothetical protein AACH06_24455 [Ideonella sp. DXS29W]|uniref:Uncharacterized protein n=1 Tax=Ideonella lacteola TaxID=2984193 RepID=A0ABU9BYS1_9BURK
MHNVTLGRGYPESTIEEEPILGRVLAMPDGRIQPLTWRDRMMLSLGLTDARQLATKYFGPASAAALPGH